MPNYAKNWSKGNSFKIAYSGQLKNLEQHSTVEWKERGAFLLSFGACLHWELLPPTQTNSRPSSTALIHLAIYVGRQMDTFFAPFISILLHYFERFPKLCVFMKQKTFTTLTIYSLILWQNTLYLHSKLLQTFSKYVLLIKGIFSVNQIVKVLKGSLSR